MKSALEKKNGKSRSKTTHAKKHASGLQKKDCEARQVESLGSHWQIDDYFLLLYHLKCTKLLFDIKFIEKKVMYISLQITMLSLCAHDLVQIIGSLIFI